MILRKGFDLWSGPKKKYLEHMENTIQTKVLGTEVSPAHWSIPFEGKNDAELKISTISGRNETVRTMISAADAIIEAAIPANEEHIGSRIIITISHYRNCVALLNKHYKLTDDEMEQFQDNADNFFHSWVDVFGRDGVTNYIHLLGSGHMLYFLKQYGCLYLYSQQGWESLMGKVQAILHLNTQRGGHGSGGRGRKKSYIYPVLLFILRDLLWKTGEAKEFFKKRDKEKLDKIGIRK
jgi:hypothetical protein